MAISIAALEAMVAGGASAEMIVAVIKADSASTDALIAVRRAKDRERKRLSRLSEKSAGQTRTETDIADVNLDLVGREELDTSGCPSESTAAAFRPNPQTAQKEIPPTPPKEKLPTKNSEQNLFNEESKEVVEIARAKRAMRLPDDWAPSRADREFAADFLIEPELTLEIDKFRDHWRAANGPPSVKRDWSAAWRNWCRNSVKFSDRSGKNGKARQSGNIVDAADRLVDRIRQWDAPAPSGIRSGAGSADVRLLSKG